MLLPEEITGVVLAGGKSSRFGSNKALSRYGDKTFLQHLIELLRPYVQEIIISGDCPEYKEYGIKCLKDEIADIGPLGGIYTALNYSTTPWILVLTCDMPLITGEEIQQMMLEGKDYDVVGWKGENGEGLFPLLLSENIIDDLENAIEAKRYQVRQLFELEYSMILEIPKSQQEHFANINNLDDYKHIIL